MAIWILIAQIIKIIATVRKYAALLSALSNGKLVEGLIGTFVVGLVKDGLVQSGVPVDRFDFIERASKWIDKVVEETAGDLAKHGLVLAPDALKRQLSDHVQRFLTGHDVAGGTSSVRHKSRGADPILFHRGEFEHVSTDLFVRGAGVDLPFRRVYRSGADVRGPIGRGWDHGLNLRLFEETDPQVLTRATGDLAHDRFVRHPRFGDADFSYFTPPDGVHDVLVPDGAGSFVLRRPLGATIEFESTGQPRAHRARAVRDGLGNELRLLYTADDRLHRVLVNSDARHVAFAYDSSGRMTELRDHGGRAVRYCYDDAGRLVAALESTAGKISGERYEYEPVDERWRLARVLDERGALLVENEYDRAVASDHFGFVIRQHTRAGTHHFTYQPLAPAPQLRARDAPVLRVFEALPDGHVVERVLNEFGNELLRREEYSDGGRRRTALTRTRFNADGMPIASMDAEGGLTQHLYQRDHVLEDAESVGVTLADISAAERLAFGNLLATVERGRALPIEKRTAEPAEWLAALWPVKTRIDAADAISKQTYDPITQVVTSRSDRRHTASPDPLHVESAPAASPLFDPTHPAALDHQRHLTTFEYQNRRRLIRTRQPDRTSASGAVAVADISDEVIRMDARGRVLEHRDRRGYILYKHYFGAGDGPKEGFLRSELRPHLDWKLDRTTPDLLEIRASGAWERHPDHWRSSGASGDALEIDVVGHRIELFQTLAQLHSGTSANVRVEVDGVAWAPWNQAAASTTVAGLTAGVHTVKLTALDGRPMTVARILTHVQTEYDVDAVGRLIAETNGRGITKTITYDEQDREVRVVRGATPAVAVLESVFDHHGLLMIESTEWRDPEGNLMTGRAAVRRRHYEATGWLSADEQTDAIGSERRLSRYRYDARGQVIAAIDPRGVRTAFSYDALGRRTLMAVAACTSVEARTLTGFDRAGRVLWERQPNGALTVHGRLGPAELLSGYDARGRRNLSTDPRGHVTAFTRDAEGRELITWRFGRTGSTYAMTSRREVTYDEHGTMTRTVDAIFDVPIVTASPLAAPDVEYLAARAGGQVREATTDYHVDGNGNITAMTDPVGGVVRRRYDPQNRDFDELDASGRRVFRVYDAAGAVLREYTFEAEPSALDAAAAVPRIFVRHFEYDPLDRRVARRDANGNAWQESFDSLGNRVVARDPVGREVVRAFNVFGEETRRRDGTAAVSVASERRYDSSGNLTALIDGRNRRHEFTYDALNRVVSTRNADLVADPGEHFVYDRAGHLLRRTDRNGMIERTTVDPEGRVLRRSFDWSGVAAAFLPSALSSRFAEFEYDANGHMIRHTNDWCTARIERDSRGLLRVEELWLTAANGVSAATSRVAQVFDDAGRLVRIDYPSGRRVAFERGADGNVLAIRNEWIPPTYPGRAGAAPLEALARFGYGIGRRLWRVSLPLAGAWGSIRYDARGHVLERALFDSSTSAMLWRTQTLRDQAGSIRKEVVDAPALPAASGARIATVDGRRQLIAYGAAPVAWIDPAAIGPPPESRSLLLGASRQMVIQGALFPSATGPAGVFEYDAAGNRLSTQETGTAPFASVADAADRYSTVAGAAWQWDPEGRLLSDGTNAYRYSADGALVEEIQPTAATATALVRDALSRVVAIVSPEGASRVVYLDRFPLVLVSAAGRSAELTPGRSSHEVLHVASEGRDLWVMNDGRGSPRFFRSLGVGLTAAADGAVSYRPFGAPEAIAGTVPNDLFPFSFAGMLRLPASAVLHSATRSYRSDIGRFVQADPAGFVDGSNRYVYANNNPLDFIDPDGLQALREADTPLLEYLEDLAARLGADPTHAGQSPTVIGQNKHLEMQTSVWSPPADAKLSGADIQRLAPEVQIDEKGIIRAVNTTPEKAMANWRTVDIGIVRPDLPGGRDAIVGRPASEVLDYVIDYKTGNAELAKRIDLESLIGNKPVVKLTGQRGQLRHFLEKRFKDMGEDKLKKLLAKAALKRLGKFGVKAIPVAGGIFTYATAEGSQAERIARGIASEVQYGPFDLEMAYDLSSESYAFFKDWFQNMYRESESFFGSRPSQGMLSR